METFEFAAAMDDALEEYMEGRGSHVLIAIADEEVDMMGVGKKVHHIGDRVVCFSILRSRPNMENMYDESATDGDLTLIYRERK